MSDPPTTVTVNVGNLSNALAVAIQQAASSGRDTTTVTPSPANIRDAPGPSPYCGVPYTPGPGTRAASSERTSSRSASLILPSYLKRKRQAERDGRSCKRQKSIQCWDRDIVCLPQQSEGHIAYPRGKYRAWLGKHGLIGKIRLMSTMTIAEVESEVRSVFQKPMGGRSDFPYVFLQPTGAGSRTLTLPSVSSSFEWTPQQVAKLASNKQAIYILAEDKLAVECKEEEADSDGEEMEDENTMPVAQNVERKETAREPSEEDETTGSESKSAYRRFVDLIDLTALSSPEHHSDDSESDLPPISISAQTRCEPVKQDSVVAKHVMQQHQRMVMSARDDEDFQRVTVRRSHLFLDAARAFSKPRFDESKMLKVVFVGEPSVDTGGPRREFFHLLMKEAFTESGLFSGWPENVVPIHNVEAVSANKYFTVGKMIATSLVQGGQPPVCFAKGVAEYLVYDEIRSDPSLNDIYDLSVRHKLRKVQEAKSSEELKKVTEEELEFRFECGYSKPTSQLELCDKFQIIKSVWLHYIYFLPNVELQQLRKGLRDTLQLELLVCGHPSVLFSFLSASSDFEVTSDYLLDSFSINYSEQGSNKRTAEEAIIINWNEYIIECADGTGEVSLGDILQFVSGSNKIPAAGLPTTPSIRFTDEKCLPRASTCDISITFPRALAFLTYEQFKERLDLCICGSFGFGQP